MGASVPQCLRSPSLDGRDVSVSWSHNAGNRQVLFLRALDVLWKRWIHTLGASDTQHNSQQKRTDGYLTNHHKGWLVCTLVEVLFLRHGRCRILSLHKKNHDIMRTFNNLNGSMRTFNKKRKGCKNKGYDAGLDVTDGSMPRATFACSEIMRII